MMSPIGAIALATIFDLERLCENEAEACEEIVKDLDTFSQKLDKIGEILFERNNEENIPDEIKLKALQNHKMKFYMWKYLPLVEKFNSYGLEYTAKKEPSRKEHTLTQEYDTVELERSIQKQYDDIKTYHTITMMRCDVFFTQKINNKRRKEIHVMLDEFHRLLTKHIVKFNGKLKKGS